MSVYNFVTKNTEQGFTLLELLIVIVIFAIMSGVGIAEFRKYEFNTRVENVAYDVALLVRQAEVMGVSGFQASGLDFDSNFETSDPIGIYFDYTAAGEYSSELTLYRSTGGEKYLFDMVPLNEDQIIDIATLGQGIRIEEIGRLGSSPGVYNHDISISFERPAPDPHIFRATGGGPVEITVPIYIKISDQTSERSRYVWVERTGQIHVTTSL
jgi:prepilin-type N-terminal cleavage/methylation domain-containing protein